MKNKIVITRIYPTMADLMDAIADEKNKKDNRPSGSDITRPGTLTIRAGYKVRGDGAFWDDWDKKTKKQLDFNIEQAVQHLMENEDETQIDLTVSGCTYFFDCWENYWRNDDMEPGLEWDVYYAVVSRGPPQMPDKVIEEEPEPIAKVDPPKAPVDPMNDLHGSQLLLHLRDNGYIEFEPETMERYPLVRIRIGRLTLAGLERLLNLIKEAEIAFMDNQYHLDQENHWIEVYRTTEKRFNSCIADLECIEVVRKMYPATAKVKIVSIYNPGRGWMDQGNRAPYLDSESLSDIRRSGAEMIHLIPFDKNNKSLGIAADYNVNEFKS